MVGIALVAASFAASWRVDGTSLKIHYGSAPVRSHVDCGAYLRSGPSLHGRALTTLGVAVVAYSKKQGNMTWGHGSLRAVFCLDDELVDAEYEVYRLSGWNEGLLREEHEGEAFAQSEWLETQRGAKVLFRNLDTVDSGWYALSQASNREIYEVWLDLEQGELDAVVTRAETAWIEQRERLRANQPLPERYHPIRRNCTEVYGFLPSGLVPGAPFTPFAWVRRLLAEGRDLDRVMYPSHHFVNRWRGILPAQIERPHPVFRRRRAVRREHLPRLRASLEGARPALPFSRPGAPSTAAPPPESAPGG